MATFAAGSVAVDMDQLDLGSLAGGSYVPGGGSAFTVQTGPRTDNFTGSGLLYSGAGVPSAGVITGVEEFYSGAMQFSVTGASINAATFFGWVAAGDSAAAKINLLAGSDALFGSGGSDLLRGYAGADTIQGGDGSDRLDGGEGDDRVFGGPGNDVVTDSGGANYLRGDEGDDNLVGGAEFDDINGNMGDDTGSGGPGDDWVVGGKDNDLLFGDEGGDIVYGNLGNDTCHGGAGADLIRGGQSDDVLTGGAGADWLSGDRDSDTVTGGSGADIFHSFGDAGLDRVTDFSLAEGDRVQLDPGTTYTLAQLGADTVITMGGGGQVVLVGVTMSTLTASSIFLA